MQNNIIGTMIIEGFCFALMLMVYINLYSHIHNETPDRTLFRYLVVSALFTTVFDAASWLVDGQMFPYSIALNRFINAICHLSVPVLMFIWLLYLDYKINEDLTHLKKAAPIYAIPMLISVGMCFINLFTDLLFTITDQNVYQRKTAYWITIGMLGIYIVFSLVYVVLKRKKIRHTDFISRFTFPFPMVLMSFLQTLNPGISCLLMGLTFSIMEIFIYLQNSSLSEDPLTKLSNRRHLEEYLDAELSKLSGNKRLAGIMLDMDDFKSINDRFGHGVGDEALEVMSELMRSSVRDTDLCARLSGDEFLMVAKVRHPEDLVQIVERLAEKTLQYNVSGKAPYTLSYSSGTYIASASSGDTTETFLHTLDSDMYQHKKHKKAR